MAEATDEAKLRARLLKETLVRPNEFRARIEQASDNVYIIKIEPPDDEPRMIRVRRWSQGELNKLESFPFYQKLITNEELSDDDMKVYLAVQSDMVKRATIDIGTWTDFFDNNPLMISHAFEALARISGFGEEFAQELRDFMNSDLGFSYGLLWFYIMRKTPSEIAELPATDVMVINEWITRWHERAIQSGR